MSVRRRTANTVGLKGASKVVVTRDLDIPGFGEEGARFVGWMEHLRILPPRTQSGRHAHYTMSILARISLGRDAAQ